VIVPDEVRKCVAFIGYEDGGQRRFAGSVFFLGRDTPGGRRADPVYAVTARHVVELVRNRGNGQPLLRVNCADGQAKWVPTDAAGWFSPPDDGSVDVAILRAGIPEGLDHLVFPYSQCVDEEKLRANEVGLGDEVFVTGLLRYHPGTRKNEPVVRIGNLACMPEDKVLVSPSFGAMDAYLIEARSIGGLSGSPVFLNLGPVRMLGANLRFQSGGPNVLLLGLIHGHFDTAAVDIDEVDPTTAADRSGGGNVNAGMAIVVPFKKIAETIAKFENLTGYVHSNVESTLPGTRGPGAESEVTVAPVSPSAAATEAIPPGQSPPLSAGPEGG
jgi:hypothetical protein